MLKTCDTAGMIVTYWGGPKDGQIIDVRDGTREWRVPVPSQNVVDWLSEPEPTPQPTFKLDIYKIMKTTRGWMAVHPSINTEALS